MAYYSDEPSADAGALPVWFLSHMTAKHVTVALSGEGADEIFGGYQTYLADRYAQAARYTPAALRKLALHAAAKLPVSDEKIGLEYKVKRFLAGSLLSADEAHFYWNGTFSQSEQRAARSEVAIPSQSPAYATLFPVCRRNARSSTAICLSISTTICPTTSSISAIA